jgi:hypothetical protein
VPVEWRVNEQGDEIFLKVQMESIGFTTDVTLTRKEQQILISNCISSKKEQC